MYHNQQQQQPDPFRQILNFNGQQVPPVPRMIQCGNLASPHEVNQIHAGLIQGMFNKAQRGHPLRVYMLNVLSQAGFENQEYAAMLDGAIEFYAYLRQATNQNDPMGVTVNTIINTELAAFCRNHGECQNYIDQPTAQNLQNYAQQFDQISHAIRQWNQQQQSMMNGYGNQGGMQWPNQQNNMGMNQGNMMGYQPNQMNNQMNNQFGGGHNNFGGMNNASTMNRRPNRFGGNGNNNNADMLSSNRGPQNNNVTSSMNRPRADRFASRSAGMDPTPDHRPNDNGATFDTSNVNQSKGPKSRYLGRNQQQDNIDQGDNDMQMFDDTTRQITGHQRRLEVEEALSSMPDPLKEEYHRRLPAVPRSHKVIATGDQFVVVEGNNMDYADHESDPKMVALSKTNKVQPKVVEDESRWPLMSRPDVVEAGKEHEELDEVVAESLIYDGPVKASSIYEAISNCYIGLTDEMADENGKLDPKFFNEKAVEFYPHFTQQVVGATKDDMELIERLRNTRSARELVSSLRDYASDLTDHVWHMLQSRLTDVVNRRLKVYTSGAIEIDSIADDYDDLMDALNGGNHTSESIENFKQRLHLELKRACIIRSYQLDESEDLEGVQEFYTSAAIVHLPWTSNAIDIKLPSDGTPAMITRELSEDILTACMSLIKRTSHDSKNPASRRFMVTRDGVVVEIFEGEFGEASVLMALHKGADL
tara:strand:- start:66632 stop:68740 length:2109 start_codon:yes stop_codon:yes gene_type:complete